MLEMAKHVLMQLKVHDWTFEKTRHITFCGILLTNTLWVRNDSGKFYIGYHTFSLHESAVTRRQ
jgi:hypothetical protein